MTKTLLQLEDLNGHGTKRTLEAIQDSLKETGGIVAVTSSWKGAYAEAGKVIAVVKCVYDADQNAFVLKIRVSDAIGAEWETAAVYTQNRVELASLDFVREVFEAEGRDD